MVNERKNIKTEMTKKEENDTGKRSIEGIRLSKISENGFEWKMFDH